MPAVREVVLTPMAVRQLRRLPKEARKAIVEGMRMHLVDADPTESTPNKFRLRRLSEHADFELRVDPWRVFYRVSGRKVIVTLVGRKDRNCLLIDGEEFLL